MIPRNTYVGKRYIPKHCGDWDNTKNTEYESLSVVLWQGASYTSRQDVPRGIDIENILYWVRSADYNAQVAIYEQNVRDYHQFVIDQIGIINTSNSDFQDNVNLQLKLSEDITGFINVLKTGIDDLLPLIEGDNSANAILNTTRLQAIIDYSVTNYQNGSKVIIFFPSGIYSLNNGIMIGNNISLYGQSASSQPTAVTGEIYKGGTILKDCSDVSATDDFIMFKKSDASRIVGCCIKDINFTGNHQEHNGLHLYKCGWDSRIENVSINQFKKRGIYFNSQNDTSIVALSVIDCGGLVDNIPYYAVDLGNDTGDGDRTNALHFTNCHFEISPFMLKVDVARQNCFSNCKFEPGVAIQNSIDKPTFWITPNAQDTQFVGCSIIGYSKNERSSNCGYEILIENSSNSLANNIFQCCEFISVNGAYKLLKCDNNTIINGCGFQILSSEDYSLWIEGDVSNISGNIMKCLSGDTKTTPIYIKNANFNNNNVVHYRTKTNSNEKAVIFEGENVNISDNYVNGFERHFVYIGGVNTSSFIKRKGHFNFTDDLILKFYGIDMSSASSGVNIPIDLNDCQNAEIIEFNCSKNVSITDIKNAVGIDNITIGNASGNVVYIASTSTTGGSRIFNRNEKGANDINLFGRQFVAYKFVSYYWMEKYRNTDLTLT